MSTFKEAIMIKAKSNEAEVKDKKSRFRGHQSSIARANHSPFLLLASNSLTVPRRALGLELFPAFTMLYLWSHPSSSDWHNEWSAELLSLWCSTLTFSASGFSLHPFFSHMSLSISWIQSPHFSFWIQESMWHPIIPSETALGHLVPSHWVLCLFYSLSVMRKKKKD